MTVSSQTGEPHTSTTTTEVILAVDTPQDTADPSWYHQYHSPSVEMQCYIPYERPGLPYQVINTCLELQTQELAGWDKRDAHRLPE